MFSIMKKSYEDGSARELINLWGRLIWYYANPVFVGNVMIEINYCRMLAT